MLNKNIDIEFTDRLNCSLLVLEPDGLFLLRPFRDFTENLHSSSVERLSDSAASKKVLSDLNAFDRVASPVLLDLETIDSLRDLL